LFCICTKEVAGGDEVQIARSVITVDFIGHEEVSSTAAPVPYVSNEHTGAGRVVPSLAEAAKLGQSKNLFRL
jgi:hypothetical protein